MKEIVSIIIPTFNRKTLLSETLKSVANQSYQNWECIVIDDGSTDETEDYMNEFCEKNPKFKFFKRPESVRKGASSCRNFGIESSKGEFLQFLDSDDLLGKTKLEEQMKLLKNEKEDTLMTCKWGFFSDERDLYRRFKFEYKSYKNLSPGHRLLDVFGKNKEFFPLHVYLFPKKIIKKSGLWNEELSNNDDAEFFMRVLFSVSHICFAPNAEVFYRLHPGEKLSDLHSKKKFEDAIRSWELMEVYLKNKTKGKFGSQFIRSGKLMVHTRAIKKCPDIIEEHYKFFKSVIPFHERLFKKFF